MKSLHALLLAFLSLPMMPVQGSAQAQEVVPLASFDRIELRGGGRVVVRYGPDQRVTLRRGSRAVSDLRLERSEDGPARLLIDACRRSCGDYDLEVEVVLPRLAALSVRGGGSVEVSQSFPAQPAFAAAVQGGGTIDARGLAPDRVAASISGGGTILVDPDRQLTASVRGGGLIRYWGDPAVTRAVAGGGAIQQAR